MKVSFSGIYDIRFPLGTNEKDIKKKYLKAQNICEKMFPDETFRPIDVRYMDWFGTKKTAASLAQKGIRISTPVDNPWILCEFFSNLDKKLSQEYVNQSKVELLLNA